MSFIPNGAAPCLPSLTGGTPGRIDVGNCGPPDHLNTLRRAAKLRFA